MEATERTIIVDKIDEEINRAKENIPTPFVGIIDAVWWNTSEGKVIRSHFKMALDDLSNALKLAITNIGR